MIEICKIGFIVTQAAMLLGALGFLVLMAETEYRLWRLNKIMKSLYDDNTNS